MDTDQSEPFGAMVKRLRERLGVSQQELVRRTEGKVSTSHIGRIETGHLGARPEKVDILAEALEATSDERQALLVAAGHGPDERSSLADRVAHLEAGVAELRREVTEAIRRLPRGTPRGGGSSKR